MTTRRLSKRLHEDPAVPYLPDELLLFNILPRLPVKSLYACKAVCKRWHHLISQHSPDLLVVYTNDDGGLSFFPAFEGSVPWSPPVDGHLPPGLKITEILASENGLLCLSVLCKGCREDSFLYVCNPATGKGEMVPGSRNRDSMVHLAFDPWSSPGRYKLVHLRKQPALDRRHWIEVFSSDTGSWVRSRQEVVISESIHVWVFVGGVLYWTDDDDKALMSYDVERDLAAPVEPPEKRPRTLPKIFMIGKLEGWLACARMRFDQSMEVWTMSGGQGGWARRRNVRNWFGMMSDCLAFFVGSDEAGGEGGKVRPRPLAEPSGGLVKWRRVCEGKGWHLKFLHYDRLKAGKRGAGVMGMERVPLGFVPCHCNMVRFPEQPRAHLVGAGLCMRCFYPTN